MLHMENSTEIALTAHLVEAALSEIKAAALGNVRFRGQGWVERVGLLADLVDHSAIGIVTCPDEALERIAARVGHRWQYVWLVETTDRYFLYAPESPVPVWMWCETRKTCTYASSACQETC